MSLNNDYRYSVSLPREMISELLQKMSSLVNRKAPNMFKARYKLLRGLLGKLIGRKNKIEY